MSQYHRIHNTSLQLSVSMQMFPPPSPFPSCMPHKPNPPRVHPAWQYQPVNGKKPAEEAYTCSLGGLSGKRLETGRAPEITLHPMTAKRAR